MSLRINTNLASIQAQGQMRIVSRDLQKSLSQLASGSRFTFPGADAANSAISETLRAQERGLKAASQNAEVATSFVQTAEGSLSEQSNILIRIRELAVQAGSDTYSETERGFLNLEAEQLKAEFDRIAMTTKFGSTALLSGKSSRYEFQVGAGGSAENQIAFTNDADTRAGSLDVDGIDLSSKSDARDAMNTIDAALLKINGTRAQFGAVQSRLETAQNFLSSHVAGVSEAKSKITDVDVAEAVSNVRKNQVLQQYQAQVLSEANNAPLAALKLIA
jgi:flagellin